MFYPLYTEGLNWRAGRCKFLPVAKNKLKIGWQFLAILDLDADDTFAVSLCSLPHTLVVYYTEPEIHAPKMPTRADVTKGKMVTTVCCSSFLQAYLSQYTTVSYFNLFSDQISVSCHSMKSQRTPFTLTCRRGLVVYRRLNVEKWAFSWIVWWKSMASLKGRM